MKNKNVVILMTDQQRWDTIHTLGNKTIKTPNLDRLCESGVAFTHAFSPVPVCGPARDRLFTGADSRTLGDVSTKLCWRPNIRPLQSVLAEAGYKTGGFGKMHFNPTRDSHGFTHFALHEEMQSGGCEYREDDDYFSYLAKQGLGHVRYPCGVRGLLYSQPQISPIPEEHHETKWVADQALDFIDAFHRAPFLCYTSWMQPHWPVHVPKEWADLYSIDEIEPPVWSEEEQAEMPWIARLMRRAADMADEGKAPAMERILRAKALYYSSISYIDHQVGRILDRLERYKLLDDTLIVFTTDHGEMLYDHLSTAKCLAYEPSIRIPLIVSGPGMRGAGVASDDFSTLLDIAPTVYQFTGVTPPPTTPLAGASLLEGREKVKERDAVFTELADGPKGGFVSIRTRRWKYVFNHFAGVRQLFDLEHDPHELINCLIDPSPENAGIADGLHKRLLDWSREHSVDSRIVDGDFVVVPEPPVWPDRNAQREDFVDNLPDDEKSALWSEARSVYEAIKDEPHLDVADLDLEFWESRRGKGCIAELEELMGKKLR